MSSPDADRRRQLDGAVELTHFAFRAMTARPDALLASRGLSRVHHRILHFVLRLPAPSVSALLRTLGVTKQALNGPLRDLYAQKLITFTRSTTALCSLWYPTLMSCASTCPINTTSRRSGPGSPSV